MKVLSTARLLRVELGGGAYAQLADRVERLAHVLDPRPEAPAAVAEGAADEDS